jgi:multiple sugar transport system permease protein
VYAGLATLGVIVSSVPVAYALSVIKWRGQRAVFLLVISTMMLPSQVTIVPLFLFFKHLGWVGSLRPLIVPAVPRRRVLDLPPPAVLLDDPERARGRCARGRRESVPDHVARRREGGETAIAAVGLFQFLYAWNDFFGPLIYSLNNDKIWTLSVGLQQFTTIHRGVQYNQQMAASVVFILPVILLFLIAQKAFIEGVTLTGVKG